MKRWISLFAILAFEVTSAFATETYVFRSATNHRGEFLEVRYHINPETYQVTGTLAYVNVRPAPVRFTGTYVYNNQNDTGKVCDIKFTDQPIKEIQVDTCWDEDARSGKDLLTIAPALF